MDCESCGSKMQRTKVPFHYKGLYMGRFAADQCVSCCETYLTPSAVKKIIAIAKRAGLWGITATDIISPLPRSSILAEVATVYKRLVANGATVYSR